MKTSVIRYRVADFLRQYPPFESFSLEDLLTFSGVGRVIFHEDDIYLFRKGETRDPVLWVIQQGRVEILDVTPTGEQLRDVLGAGDILGLGQATSTVHLETARTATEVILYAFDPGAFESLVAKYPAAGHFLIAHFSAAAQQTKALQAPANRERLLTEKEKNVWLNAPSPPAEWISRRMRVMMGDIADEARLQLVIDRRIPISTPGLRSSDYMLQMLRRRCSALAITSDGTIESPLQGIVMESDLTIQCGRNAIPLIREMTNAESVADLVYLRGKAAEFIAEGLVGPSVVEWFSLALSELNDAMTEAVVRIAAAEMTRAGRPAPGLPSCRLFFGRAGRREILTAETPELGIVYADPPPEKAEEAANYFSTLVQKTLAKLHACGLQTRQPTSGPATPSRKPVCRTLSEWKAFYSDLIRDPIGSAIYGVREHFDFHLVGGDPAMEAELKKYIPGELAQNESFLPVLANDTIAQMPPLTFFQGFVIESDGASRQALDIEKTALGPIVDAARVFALAQRDAATANTVQRLTASARALPQYASILNDAADGWRILAYHHALSWVSMQDDNAVIRPPRLDRFEQRLLKTAFDSTRRFLELTASVYNINTP